MSIDKVVIKKLKEKLIQKDQSEELVNEITNFLNNKDVHEVDLEEKNQIIEKILDKVKLWVWIYLGGNVKD